eukprot:2421914-Amphidinium_carterae.1
MTTQQSHSSRVVKEKVFLHIMTSLVWVLHMSSQLATSVVASFGQRADVDMFKLPVTKGTRLDSTEHIWLPPDQLEDIGRVGQGSQKRAGYLWGKEIMKTLSEEQRTIKKGIKVYYMATQGGPLWALRQSNAMASASMFDDPPAEHAERYAIDVAPAPGLTPRELQNAHGSH